jgi:signal transduction histidine kinase
LTQLQHQSFLTDADFVTNSIFNEIDHYEQVLLGTKGLFAASEIVELDEWRAFINTHNIPTRYPGLQGIGYAQHTMHEDQAKLISLMKEYGVENYQIKPSGDRSEYYPVMFLEPLDMRNKNAIGYDIYFEQTRHDAVNTSIEIRDTAITKKIILVQEIDENIQNGFLMLIPIFSNADSDSLQGIVYAVFRINDFIQVTINMQQFDHIRLKIYDDYISDETLFFNSDDISESILDDIDFSTTITPSIHNKHWVFVYDGVKNSIDSIQHLILFSIPLVGFSMSFLLFYIFRIFGTNLRLTQNAINTEKIAAMGMMASRLSHDLRNPLFVMKSTLELMVVNLGSNMDEKTEKFVKRMNNSIETMSNIIEDVLQFSRTSDLKKESLSLNATLQSVISNINVPNKIKILLPDDDYSINCDKNKIKSVFFNLFTNAIQSIEDYGTISVGVEDDLDKIIISFEDSGSGIPKDKLDRIFEPLFTTKLSGTGLGLGICKNIIERHGGTISVKNNPTTFRITLPKS